jgi:hypothetical protein
MIIYLTKIHARICLPSLCYICKWWLKDGSTDLKFMLGFACPVFVIFANGYSWMEAQIQPDHSDCLVVL